MQTHTIKSYSYDELSDEAKQKVIEKFYDINVEFGDWNEFVMEDIVKKCEDEFGITFDPKHACYDLDRGQQFYIDAKHDGSAHIAQIFIKDWKVLYKALKARGVKQRIINRINDDRITVTIDMKHYGGGDGTNFAYTEVWDDNVSNEERDTLDNALNDILEEIEGFALKMLRAEYDYQTSEEAIIETIRANDYQFSEDGSRSVYL